MLTIWCARSVEHLNPIAKQHNDKTIDELYSHLSEKYKESKALSVKLHQYRVDPANHKWLSRKYSDNINVEAALCAASSSEYALSAFRFYKGAMASPKAHSMSLKAVSSACRAVFLESDKQAAPQVIWLNMLIDEYTRLESVEFSSDTSSSRARKLVSQIEALT